MLYIKIPKDLREYKQKVFMGRTAQELFWVVLALIAGGTVFAVCWFTVGTQIGSYVTMAVALPIFFCGFVTIQDMTALEFIKKVVIYYKRNGLLKYDNSYLKAEKEFTSKEKRNYKKMIKKMNEKM